jgi:hypothetical protein
MDALTFIDKPPKAKPQPVYVVTGDEDFLKRQAIAALKKAVLGEGDDAFGLSTRPNSPPSAPIWRRCRSWQPAG